MSGCDKNMKPFGGVTPLGFRSKKNDDSSWYNVSSQRDSSYIFSNNDSNTDCYTNDHNGYISAPNNDEIGSYYDNRSESNVDKSTTAASEASGISRHYRACSNSVSTKNSSKHMPQSPHDQYPPAVTISGIDKYLQRGDSGIASNGYASSEMSGVSKHYAVSDISGISKQNSNFNISNKDSENDHLDDGAYQSVAQPQSYPVSEASEDILRCYADVELSVDDVGLDDIITENRTEPTINDEISKFKAPIEFRKPRFQIPEVSTRWLFNAHHDTTPPKIAQHASTVKNKIRGMHQHLFKGKTGGSMNYAELQHGTKNDEYGCEMSNPNQQSPTSVLHSAIPLETNEREEQTVKKELFPSAENNPLSRINNGNEEMTFVKDSKGRDENRHLRNVTNIQIDVPISTSKGEQNKEISPTITFSSNESILSHSLDAKPPPSRAKRIFVCSVIIMLLSAIGLTCLLVYWISDDGVDTISRSKAIANPLISTAFPSSPPTISLPSISQSTSLFTTPFPTWFPTFVPTISLPTITPTTSFPTITPTTSFPTITPTSSPPTTRIAPSHSPSLSALPSKHHSLVPTMFPSFGPSVSHSLFPSPSPTKKPTVNPTEAPTHFPTSSPTPNPTVSPTFSPTPKPTVSPTVFPTQNPTKFPTKNPTKFPTLNPTKFPTVSPTPPTITTFFTTAGRFQELEIFNPYRKTPFQKVLEKLPEQNGEFFVHLGDFNDPDRTGCDSRSYQIYSDLLKTSPIPAFITVGEQDWPDCPNSVSSLVYWNQHFGKIENRWKNDMAFTVDRSADRISNFAFRYRRVLFIGISFYSMKSKREADSIESRRLEDNVAWVQEQFKQHVHTFDAVVFFANESPNDNDWNDIDDDSFTDYGALLFPRLVADVFRYFDDLLILFVHESGRGKSKLQSGNFGLDYVWDLEVQGEIFPFMKVMVDTSNTESPFSFDQSQNNDKNK